MLKKEICFSRKCLFYHSLLLDTTHLLSLFKWRTLMIISNHIQFYPILTNMIWFALIKIKIQIQIATGRAPPQSELMNFGCKYLNCCTLLLSFNVQIDWYCLCEIKEIHLCNLLVEISLYIQLSKCLIA